MALIDEVKAEVIKRNTGGVQPVAEKAQVTSQPKRRRKALAEMTPAEVEAFKQRKMAEEETRLLGKPVKESAPKKKRTRTQVESTPKPTPKPAPKPSKAQRRRTAQPAPQRPKVIQPLEPLYLLKIPGLPKGDCIAICYARGADAS